MKKLGFFTFKAKFLAFVDILHRFCVLSESDTRFSRSSSHLLSFSFPVSHYAIQFFEWNEKIVRCHSLAYKFFRKCCIIPIGSTRRRSRNSCWLYKYRLNLFFVIKKEKNLTFYEKSETPFDCLGSYWKKEACDSLLSFSKDGKYRFEFLYL